MKTRAFKAIALLSLMGAAAGSASASKYVVVLHNVAGWQIQGVDKLLVNGKVKIRRGQDASPGISLDTYKRLPQENLGALPLRLHRGGYLVEKSGSGWATVFPDGLNFKGNGSAAGMWAAVPVVYQVDKTAKDQAFRPADIFAILPGTASPAEAAVAMLSDESNFRGLGEASPAEAFDDRMAMLIGIAGVADGPAQAKLKAFLAAAMNTAIQRSGAGTGRVVALTEGLRFAAVSDKAFPADPQQSALRKALRDKRAALDQRVAIVKAFAAASEWDPLIDKYGDFEEYDDAYDDVRKLHEKSFKASEVIHKTAAQDLFSRKDCDLALDEMKMALKRNPNSRELDTLYSNMRIECSTDSRTGGRSKLTRAQNLQILSHIALAESSMTDGKLDDSEAEIAAAEAVYAKDPRVVITRVKLLRARRQYSAAIDMLDRYDRLPELNDAEAGDGTTLRTKITYEMRSGRDAARAGVKTAEDAGDYTLAMKTAREGLQLDPNDPELLYHAGLNAAITRNPKEAQQFWQAYLNASQSVSAESQRRTEVRNLMGTLSAVPANASTGTPNWFSGNRVSPSLAYDPVSLAPHFHIDSIQGSRKETTSFEWNNGMLTTVRTISQMPGEGTSMFYFDYYPDRRAVRRAANEPLTDKADGLPRLTPDGPVGTGKGAWVELFNDPAVNPFMVEKLTGRRVAAIVAGNPWFNPFVWTKVHTFLAEYDAEGRVKSATPLHEAGKPLDFLWDGFKLVGIAERGGDYRREMKYDGDRITGETVQFRGKTSKITYKYSGSRLVEVTCDADFSIDGRSRQVRLGN